MDKPATPREIEKRRAIQPYHSLPWSEDAFNEIDCSTGEPDYSAFVLAADGESLVAQMIDDRDAAYIVHACNAYPHLTAINAELVEALDMARDLIQEAKGADGPNGGFITDHLDAAQGWIENALATLARAKENSNG